MRNISLSLRLVVCMVVSLVLNAIIGQHLKSAFSQKEYTVTLNAWYETDGIMELMYDSGTDFNLEQRVSKILKKGRNQVKFTFKLQKGKQLRHIRLDFGSDTVLNKVELDSLTLSSRGRILFRLKKEEIAHKVGLVTGISEVDRTTATFKPDSDRKPFDPYIVFDSVNELIFPKWQRTLALVLPWVVLLFLPLIRWIRRVYNNGHWVLFFVAIFCCAIPLKIAWVTFTTLLLMGYALFNYYKRRNIGFDPIHGAMLFFFLVPLLFLGKGELSQVAIPAGFALFAIIGSLIDFSRRVDDIKKIFTTVFLIVASITAVSWLLLIAYYGYYYKIDFPRYFLDVKAHVHATMFWLYYPHTTFLSFFILIGGIFCFDLYGKNRIKASFGWLYGILALVSLLLLGSRYAIVTGILLLVLVWLPVKRITGLLAPVWSAILLWIIFFIDTVDFRRNQLWQVSWAAFQEAPWLGHGTGTSEVLLNDMERVGRAGFDKALQMNHPHNQLLTYLIENGLVGTLLALAAFFYIVHLFAKRGNKSMVLLCFVVLLLTIIESPFRTTTSLYVIAFLWAVFAREGVKNTDEFER